MFDNLEQERAELLQRLAGLERQHEALRGHPNESRAHALHYEDLLNYQDDVRAFIGRLRVSHAQTG